LTDSKSLFIFQAMFTRLVVLFSLILVIVGIWFTMPSLHVPKSQDPQFASASGDSESTTGDSDKLASYQKRTRKHSYDRDADYAGISVFEQKSPELPSPPPSAGAIIAKAEPSTTTSVTFKDTETLKKEIGLPGSDADENKQAEVQIAYTPEETIPASNLRTDRVVKSLSIPSPGNLRGFQSSNIAHGSTSVSVDQVFTLNFSVVPDISVIDKLTFLPNLAFTKSLNGNVLTVTPSRMERATKYTFGLPLIWPCKQSLSSTCERGSNWSYYYTFQTDYKETLVYGKSEQGRDLVAKTYGYCTNQNTCKKIMLTGGIHGSEWKSGDLTQLQGYIEQNPQEILNKNKIITIVPFTNPDGTALNTRFNARNINLNRNFPAYFASCDVCGTSSLSEKESKALADLTSQLKPNVLISYHAQWPPDGIIFRGDDSNQDTINLANWVSQRTGYPVGEFDSGNNVSGDQTVWAETQGIRSLIIESTSTENSDWNKNFNLYLSLLRDF
jgi:Zinc carboxypeptidase